MQDTAVKKKPNHAVIAEGFNVLLSEAFAPYIAQQLSIAYGSSWWTEAVLRNLPLLVTSNLPKQGPWNKLVDSLDMSACLNLFTGKLWPEVFRKKLSKDHKIWADELHNIRNKWAHIGSADFSDSDTERALDTMARFAEQMDGAAADELRSMLRTVRYGSAEGSASAVVSAAAGQQDTKEAKAAYEGALQAAPPESLKSWREIIQPHPDVAEGRYRAAEFAADLSQVARGKADQEYQDPVEFFSRTYVTEGMHGLLSEAVKRVSGKGGEPVIQLKTAFGGGKTHSMLALYHLFSGRSARDVPAVRSILNDADVKELPHTNVVTIVGTALDPSKYTVPTDVPGIRVRTVWGEIAYQLARSTGNPALFEYVREADKKGVSPGSTVLQEMLDEAGPTLILMDELVAYAKKLPQTRELPAGTLDNFVTFIQELTEAAKASKNTVVVASIPESEIEIGGEAGQTVLAQIEHTFGRTEAIWKPVAAQEGFEIVRRRLFLECRDPQGRDAVCDAFARMYEEKEQVYPIDTRQPAYRERLKASYPIHPEVFDRLYEDWSTLDRFQRTRGVLRLMASVIHQLWMGQDQGLLIMPASLPLNTPAVRDELTRYLPDTWNPIVDKEVDGTGSVPYSTEKEQPRYAGKMAARRVARTVLLGSAPTGHSQRVRGLDRAQIRLGTVQPGENESLFDDALGTLSRKLSYLYEDSSGDRFWYDSQPTLRKTAADKAAALSELQVNEEIEKRLRKLKREEPFAAVHAVPHSSADVPDERQVRLVVLPPDKTFLRKQNDNSALEYAKELLNSRGTGPRVNKNMLIFLAPDETQMGSLRSSIRNYLAWKSIYDSRTELQLTPMRMQEAETRLKEAEQSVKSLLSAAYTWLLVPGASENAVNEIVFHAEQLQDAGEGPGRIVPAAAQMLRSHDEVVTTWAPRFLRELLDKQLWNGRDELAIRELWDYFCKYLYLQKLANEKVLLSTIQSGIAQKSGFSYADDVLDGKYLGLKRGIENVSAEMSGYIVRDEAALRQIVEDPNTNSSSIVDEPGTGPAGLHSVTTNKGGAGPFTVPRYGQFSMSADLDEDKFQNQIAQLSEEILAILKSQPDVQMEIRLDVEATSIQGFDEALRRDVSDNCKMFPMIKYSGFDETAG